MCAWLVLVPLCRDMSMKTLALAWLFVLFAGVVWAQLPTTMGTPLPTMTVPRTPFPSPSPTVLPTPLPENWRDIPNISAPVEPQKK